MLTHWDLLYISNNRTYNYSFLGSTDQPTIAIKIAIYPSFGTEKIMNNVHLI